MMELADVASKVVAPALRAVFKPGEISAFALRVTDELEGSVALSLVAEGETFEYLVVQGAVTGMSAEEWSENLRSLSWSTLLPKAGSAGERTETFADPPSERTHLPQIAKLDHAEFRASSQ